jgi:SAM-dependent methyltransferase
MNCRVCNASTHEIFSLGPMPLANALLDSPDEPYDVYPLTLMKCDACSLVQLEETVPPERMFVDYNYLTSSSPPMVEHAKTLVDNVLSSYKPKFVVEIGSNDGYLLQHYVAQGIRTLGIDPSEKAARHASERGVTTFKGFFDSRVGGELRETADIIHANNVLAHVPDLNDFVSGLSTLIAPDGTIIIEVPYLACLIDKTAFDTIYHEHVYYFSVTSLQKLFSRHGLTISDAQEISTHGGSLRLWMTKSGPVSVNVARLHVEESHFINSLSYYADFASRVEKCRRDVHTILLGRQVVGFGAAAKATIFLNACSITIDDLAYVVDDTPTKLGRYIPGTGLRIISSEEWLRDQPPHTLILCWNFAHDIAHRYCQSYHGKLFTWYAELVETHA